LKQLHDTLVLITGGGSGIGRQMALLFSREGSRIILWDIDETSLNSVAREIKNAGGKIWIFVCDVSDKDLVYKTADRIKRDIGKVDVLVNNAGVVSGKPFLECTDEEIKKTMRINILAHFWTVRAFLPDMIASNLGHLVTIASAAGCIGVSSLADYSASKFAAIGFIESIRMELRKTGSNGVKTTVVYPYYINTGMFEGVKTRYPLILPILDEGFVAQQIVRAVKKDREVLTMPPLVYFIPLLRLLPVKLMDRISNVLGISSTMDEFVGRKGR
jgi:all-trans-retinol dehydrogenase (NAD+)